MATSNPWRNRQLVEIPVSLSEITAQELAVKISERKLNKCLKEQNRNIMSTNDEIGEIYNPNDTNSDEAIAYLLQHQFNQEYNKMLKSTEKKFNGDSKVNISYNNYQTIPYENKDEDYVDTDDNRDIDHFVKIEKEYASIPRCGYKKVGENSQIITKHDMLISCRRNACRMFQLPPGIHTGDPGRFDVKLNNNVYNSLRAHSYAQSSREKARDIAKSKAHKIKCLKDQQTLPSNNLQ